MNWIEIEENKFELIEDFKYTGPLKSYQRNDMWSNFSYHTFKIKCSNNTTLPNLIGKELFSKYKNGNNYYNYKFTIKSIRGLSDCKDYKIIKIEVENLDIDQVSKDVERDLKLSDLFEL